MTRRYEINVHVSHVVEVEADSIEDAEERAFKKFLKAATYWDMMDMEVIYDEGI